MVRGVDDWEFGKECGAPCVLVGSGSKVNVHTQIFGEELRRVAVAHDDALEIAFEETHHVDFELLDHIAHSPLGTPHVVVQAEVDGPDACRDALRFGMVWRVVVAWESQICNRDCEQLEQEQNIEIVCALFPGCRIGRCGFALGPGRRRLGGDTKHTSTDAKHHCGHDPICVFAHKGATWNKGIGDDPDMCKDKEVVDEETNTECFCGRMTSGMTDQHRCCSHSVHGQGKCTVVTRPMLGCGQYRSTDRANSVKDPRAGNARSEEANNETEAHGEKSPGTMGHCKRTTDRIAFPDPEDHSAGVRKERVHTEEEASETESCKGCGAFGRSRGGKIGA